MDKDATASYRLYTAGSPEAGSVEQHLQSLTYQKSLSGVMMRRFLRVSFRVFHKLTGTEVILESTANGAQGEFYRLWKGAIAGENEYVPIFLPWHITPEYRRPAPEGMETTVEEEALIEKWGLDLDQLYWRRLKIAEGGKLKVPTGIPHHS